MKSEFLSVDGIIKAGITFGMINLLITFSVRYVRVIFLIIVSPFSFCFLASKSTRGIFENWLKSLLECLAVQIVIKFVLVIPIIFNNTHTLMFKIVLIGTIYIVHKVNDFCSLFIQKVEIFKAR